MKKASTPQSKLNLNLSSHFNRISTYDRHEQTHKHQATAIYRTNIVSHK